jgi:hypothetical protein
LSYFVRLDAIGIEDQISPGLPLHLFIARTCELHLNLQITSKNHQSDTMTNAYT